MKRSMGVHRIEDFGDDPVVWLQANDSEESEPRWEPIPRDESSMGEGRHAPT